MAERKKLTHEQKLHRDGQLFHLRGGPLDDCVVRLYDYQYPNPTYGRGWDELPLPKDGGRYIRPPDVDPLMKRPGKPNKKRTNIPHMVWEPSDADAVLG